MPGHELMILTTKTGLGMTLKLPRACLTSTRLRPAREDHYRILTTKTGSAMTPELARAHLRPARFRPTSEDHCHEPREMEGLRHWLLANNIYLHHGLL
jgi:hypothetical protein